MSALPAAVEADDVATSRLRTHVLRSGPRDAPALVLVHGNVSSARFFAETMAVLGGRWHCVAADLRGFGRSQRAPSTPGAASGTSPTTCTRCWPRPAWCRAASGSTCSAGRWAAEW